MSFLMDSKLWRVSINVACDRYYNSGFVLVDLLSCHMKLPVSVTSLLPNVEALLNSLHTWSGYKGLRVAHRQTYLSFDWDHISCIRFCNLTLVLDYLKSINFYMLFVLHWWYRTIEIGADRFKTPDVLFNPSLVQVGLLNNSICWFLSYYYSYLLLGILMVFVWSRPFQVWKATQILPLLHVVCPKWYIISLFMC